MPITVRKLAHTYQPGTPFARQVLFGVDLDVHRGELLGLIGPSKAGKSTLIQYLNGLLRPQRGCGSVVVGDMDTAGPKVNLGLIRNRVGLVFQFPEDQLFEPTVAADVGFGPRIQGLPPDEVAARVRQALDWVQLPVDDFGSRHVHALSGGQKRRVAIAGVLAMRPEILIVDEPTAGLDPRGREDLLSLLSRMHQELQMTVVIVSNNLDEVARLCRRVVVLVHGKVVMSGTPRQVFGRPEELNRLALPALRTVALMQELARAGLPVAVDCLTVDEMCDEIHSALQGRQLRSATGGGLR